MSTRKWPLMMCGAVLLAAMAAPAVGAFGILPKRTTYVTFDRQVALPGATLNPGTYIFEIADPNVSSDIVQVLSRDRRHVYLLGFTQRVRRPAYVRENTFVSLAEAPAGTPRQITTWWPAADSTGRMFLYDAR